MLAQLMAVSPWVWLVCGMLPLLGAPRSRPAPVLAAAVTPAGPAQAFSAGSIGPPHRTRQTVLHVASQRNPRRPADLAASSLTPPQRRQGERRSSISIRDIQRLVAHQQQLGVVGASRRASTIMQPSRLFASR